MGEADVRGANLGNPYGLTAMDHPTRARRAKNDAE
jgi:hypothetical protein